MAWNEPGGNNKDPWGRKDNKDGPPDLEEIAKALQERLNTLFGRGSGNEGNHGGDDGGEGGEPSRPHRPSGGDGIPAVLIAGLLVAALVIWSAFGIYTVQPAEQGIVMRFGKYIKTTEQGLNWYFPAPVGKVIKVNVDEVRALRHQALMLTKDENIVEIELVVQYKIDDAYKYLFNVRDPDSTLQQATESALREVVGMSRMDDPQRVAAEQPPVADGAEPPTDETIYDILTSGRAKAAEKVQALLQEILNRYQTGLLVHSVNMQDAQPPEAVQDAFADAIKAREDEERQKNTAEAYRNEVVQQTKGAVDRIVQEAEGYKSQVVSNAKGETNRFLSVMAAYQENPDITRRRMYLETMQSVLGNSSKVLVDIEKGNPLLMLPLEKLTQFSAPEADAKTNPARMAEESGSPTPAATIRPDRDGRQPERSGR